MAPKDHKIPQPGPITNNTHDKNKKNTFIFVIGTFFFENQDLIEKNGIA